jgi:hypothetical protein
MPRWPEAEVIWFSPPWPGVRVWASADWVRTVVEADWLWRHGADSVDIAAALGLREGDALRAVSQGRAARRNSSEGERCQ